MNRITALRRWLWAVRGRRQIKKLVRQQHKNNAPLKIILGSSSTQQMSGGWINTDIPQFDITNASHWNYLFGSVKIDNLLAEHVLEHLSQEQITTALKMARQYLKAGGTFRVAIPDKNNTSPVYQEATKPGGSGPGAHDHKVFLSLYDCINLANTTGFDLVPLEYFDDQNQFHYTEFDELAGEIQRSRQKNYHYSEVPGYTSLIFDLKAPII